MHIQIITRFIALLILFLGLSMAVPLLVSFLYKDGSTRPLLLSMIITTLTGLIIFFFTKKHKDNYLSHRDGIAIVSLGWIMAGLFGTLPFIFSGAFSTGMLLIHFFNN